MAALLMATLCAVAFTITIAAASPPPAPPAAPPAAPTPPPPSRSDAIAALPPAPSAADLAAIRRQVEALTDLDDATRAAALAALDRAQAKLAAMAEAIDRVSRGEQVRIAAAAELAQAKVDLAALKDPAAAAAASVAAAVEASASIPDADTPKALRQKREEADAALALAKERVAELDRDLKQRAERRAALPTEIGRAAADLDELAAAPEIVAGDRNPAVVAAERAERAAMAGELRSRLDALRAEQAAIDGRGELDTLLKERAAKRVALREAEAQAWQRRADAAVALAADREALDARRETAQGAAPVRAISRKTLELIEQRTGDGGLIARNAETRQRLERLATRLPMLAAEYDRERMRAASTGTSGLTSARLRLQRAQLPDARYLADIQGRVREDLFTTQRRQADLEAEIAALPSPADERDGLLATMEDETGAMAAELRGEVAAELDRRIAEQRRQYDLLLAAYREREELLLRAMEGLPGVTALAEQFSSFIDRRILWIRSVEPIGVRDLERCWTTLKGLGASLRAVIASGEMARTTRAELVVLGLVAALVVGWIASIGRRRRAFASLAGRASRYATDGMGLTVAASALTALEAAFWPCIILLVCARVGVSTEASPPLQALVAGARRMAVVLFVMMPIFALVRTNGLAKAHFGWRDETRHQLRKWLRWLAVVALPASFIVGATEWTTREAGSDLLGRLVFVVAMLATAATSAVLLRPHRGVLAGVVAASRSRWMRRLEPLWRVLAVSTPLALALLAALGWYYTALQLDGKLVASAGFVTALIFADAFIKRWLLLSRRRLAVAELQKRREALRTADGPGQAASAEGGSVAVDEATPNMSTIDAQTRQLLGTALTFTLLLGLWGIWAQVLPALDGLNRFEIWPRFGNVREAATLPPPSSEILGTQRRIGPAETTAGAGTASVAPAGDSESPDAALPSIAAPAVEDAASNPLTLGNIVAAIIIVIATIILARNIPGLLEISILQRLPVENSVRYAITTLTSYAAWGVGIVLTFAAVGIGWSQVQWLVAGVSVGIGFGLQEIVANLISGVIILFEQPIRVGDTVTVNGITGTVSRIRIRATTITDGDRKELIVPNRTFITGQVINWTLSDAALRIVVPVGVDYGADPKLVVELLQRIAAENKTVMKDPAPAAIFVGFGDSTLNFELRAVVPSIEHLSAVRHDLHMVIAERFKAANLNIAFPQRDVHVTGALEVLPRKR